ncbi:MAG TPA: TMEM175 family protein [Gemmatimonadaceae bacterium]|jgi:uncharacterized membrane protein
MKTSRLEAFSDGVIAILITIMVLELKVPHDSSIGALGAMVPVLLSYLMSFIYLGIYWNNHHHLLAATDRISGGVLWANNHLLFWLSLVPFVTSWMDENHFAPVPTAMYGVVLFCSAIAYTILVRAIIRADGGSNKRVAAAIGSDRKGSLSLLFYLAGIPLAFVHVLFADAMYIAVALVWLIPDRRIEHHLHESS